MALKPCKECKKEVSTKAKKCPNCGAPTKSELSGFQGCLVIIAVGVFLSMLGGGSEPAKQSKAERPNKERHATAQKKKQVSPGQARTNPAPVNQVINYKAGNWLAPSHSVDLQILKVARGKTAHELAERLNQFNSIPEGETELIVLKMGVKVVHSEDENTSFSFYPGQFDLFSSSGAKYESRMMVGLKPVMRGELFEMGSANGWIVFEVDKNDQSPLLSYGRNSIDGTGGVWWKL